MKYGSDDANVVAIMNIDTAPASNSFLQLPSFNN
jgi:hypothetical protein